VNFSLTTEKRAATAELFWTPCLCNAHSVRSWQQCSTVAVASLLLAGAGSSHAAVQPMCSATFLPRRGGQPAVHLQVHCPSPLDTAHPSLLDTLLLLRSLTLMQCKQQAHASICCFSAARSRPCAPAEILCCKGTASGASSRFGAFAVFCLCHFSLATLSPPLLFAGVCSQTQWL
jgi:hypothetical protein